MLNRYLVSLCSYLKLLESPRPNLNGSVKSRFPLMVPIQPESPLENRNRFLINFRCFLLDYFVNFLIMLMLSKFLCLAKKIKIITLFYLLLALSLYLLLNHFLTFISRVLHALLKFVLLIVIFNITFFSIFLLTRQLC